MRKLLMLLLLAVPMLCMGQTNTQTIPDIELSPADASLAQHLYAQQAAINKQIEDLRTHIKKVYLASGKAATLDYHFLIGDFEFSEDYKFIVPTNSWLVSSGIVSDNSCLTFTGGYLYYNGCTQGCITFDTGSNGLPFNGALTTGTSSMLSGTTSVTNATPVLNGHIN